MIRALAVILVLCGIFLFPLKAFGAYDPPLDQVYLYVDTEGGMRPPLYDLAKVPRFCLYRSGEVLYSFYNEREGRNVLMKGSLETKECEELISFFKSKGLDDWSESYEDCPLKDMPTTKIILNLGNGDIRRINIAGLEYAMKQKTIPEGLIQSYRKIQFFSLPSAVEYAPEKIVLFVKKVPEEPKGPGVRIHKWGSKIDLAPLASEAGLSGYGSVSLEGKNAKNTVRDLKEKVLFSKPEYAVYFKQGKAFYSLGYRPMLLHEYDRTEKKEKKKPSKKEEPPKKEE
ncbi:MAG: hypothetical protein RDV48_08940 [Candidatus Eremiobacteraeota bacterium]|nr:hypothetical protein [Candidatus Eremiobacteraeota bacterium]